MGEEKVAEQVAHSSLEAVHGIGPKTAKVIREAVGCAMPGHLEGLEQEATAPLASGGERLLVALRDDCHPRMGAGDDGARARRRT
jgi:putative hydrolase